MPDKETRTTLMFSATFPEAVQTQAKELLKENYLFAAIGMVGGASETVTQEILGVERKECVDVLKGIFENIEANGNRTLVFVETKRQICSRVFTTFICILHTIKRIDLLFFEA